MSTVFPVKDVGETVTVMFDFSSETASVSAPTVACSVLWSATSDGSPSAVLSGSPQVSGSNAAQVLQKVTGGVDLTNYALRCTATAANGDTLVVAATLLVRRLPQ